MRVQFLQPVPIFYFAMLSKGERQILALAGEGLTDKEISARLGIAFRTVRSYWDRIFWKLDARSRTHAYAVHFGDAADCPPARDGERLQAAPIHNSLPFLQPRPLQINTGTVAEPQDGIHFRDAPNRKAEGFK